MVEPKTSTTYADYLQLQQESETKHEWLQGELFAMSGASRRHNRIAGNVYFALRNQLAGGPCEAWNSDQRVRSAWDDLTAYPDVHVVCGEPEGTEDDPSANAIPAVLVEVLSESTRSRDLGFKLPLYRRMPSVRHVLFLHQDERRAELYTRVGDLWQLRDLTEGDVELDGVGARLAFDAIYEGSGV